MYRVLVVGERPDEAKALGFRMSLLGYETAPSANELTLALRSLFAFKPDIIVLYASMAPGSRELFRLLDEVSQLPIVVLGDGRAMDDLLWYLGEGAIDYLVKPVSPSLLAARIGGVLRRTTRELTPETIRIGGLEIDVDRYQVRKNGAVVSLTPTEFKLLQTLAENKGRPCRHRMLLERVWGKDFVYCAHYLRLYIGYLRQKLEDDPKSPRLLLTEWGVGYRLVADHSVQTGPVLQPVRAAFA